jgi:molybdopterin-binding protein
MFQAKTLPHRIALIDNGRITEVGTPTQIFGKLSKNLARFGAIENTFAGTARITEAGTTIVDIGNGVQIESTLDKQGEITIFISPQDIIISRKQVESSARNVFKGRISQISDSNTHANLTVDVGKLFSVQITKRSFHEMALNLGDEVLIVFKASNVQSM